MSSSKGADERISWKVGAPPLALASGTGAGPSGGRITEGEELVFPSQIDPALLDEETLASLEVAKEDITALQEAIMIPDEAGADMEE